MDTQSIIRHESPDRVIRVLGSGRGAEARLVAFGDGRNSNDASVVVEKVFRPGRLTRLIYWLCFQSPFPYRASLDAVLAAYYRRKVVAKLLRFAGLDAGIADAAYVRWSEADKAFVLGSEFIAGTGLRVDEVDSRGLRRVVWNWAVAPLLRLLGKQADPEPAPHSHAKHLVALMHGIEALLRQAGLVGAGWQVSPRALVSTANLLHNGSRYVIVDVESGIPALLVPYYVKAALRLKKFPLFDDLDAVTLRAFCHTHQAMLRDTLGERDAVELQTQVEALIHYTQQWKDGEIALFRNLWPNCQRSIKASRLAWWEREGLLDTAGKAALEACPRFFLTPFFMSGIFPGKLGRFLRKWQGNTAFRNRCTIFLTDPQARAVAMRVYMQEHVARWEASERISPRTGFVDSTNFSPQWIRFVFHLILSRLLPSTGQRFCTDAAYRSKIFTTFFLFFRSERFQAEYAKYRIDKNLKEWEADGRLDATHGHELRTRMEEGAAQEYLRGFGLHLALKFLSPITTALKIIGVGWFLQSFAQIYPDIDPHESARFRFLTACIGTCLASPLAVLMIMSTSVLRTSVTLWRMLSRERRQRRHLGYAVALVFGLLPVLGSFAFPLQMYAECRDLSIFIMRHLLAKIGHALPIYGGKHTRIEVWSVRLANWPIEMLDMLHAGVHALQRLQPQISRREKSPQSVSSASAWSFFRTRQQAENQDSSSQAIFESQVDKVIAQLWTHGEHEAPQEG